MDRLLSHARDSAVSQTASPEPGTSRPHPRRPAAPRQALAPAIRLPTGHRQTYNYVSQPVTGCPNFRGDHREPRVGGPSHLATRAAELADRRRRSARRGFAGQHSLNLISRGIRAVAGRVHPAGNIHLFKNKRNNFLALTAAFMGEFDTFVGEKTKKVDASAFSVFRESKSCLGSFVFPPQ